MKTCLRRKLLLTCINVAMLAATLATANASDHLDTAAVIADPASDIGDLYAWTSSDGSKLNLVMTIVGGKFSDHVRYEFHVDSGRTLGNSTATVTLSCEFNSAFAPDCRLGDADRARGDASVESGIESERRRFRVFAGLRDDPFFNNVRGTRAALNVAGAAMASRPKDERGCPAFDAAIATRIRDEWRHTDGHAGANFLAGWKTAALVVEVDLDAVSGGGPLLGVWATTTVRGKTPGHERTLEDGVPIDRVGRVLTGNALLGLFDTQDASNARKSEYNRAPREAWSSFAPDIAAALATYDAFDGVCGNQWQAARDSASTSRYESLARLLADDRLWVNSAARTCRQYLAAEFNHVGKANHDCGGRTPNYDAVDVFRSLLVNGGLNGIDDGVERDDRQHSDSGFPFLAPPVLQGADEPLGKYKAQGRDHTLLVEAGAADGFPQRSTGSERR
ncbi:MAG TPA: DUF4331 family protein [Steroidobacteraceae bacterium]|nr:DUF4331 family protein [Steroidobacteraceae bacterium]